MMGMLPSGIKDVVSWRTAAFLASFPRMVHCATGNPKSTGKARDLSRDGVAPPFGSDVTRAYTPHAEGDGILGLDWVPERQPAARHHSAAAQALLPHGSPIRMSRAAAIISV